MPSVWAGLLHKEIVAKRELTTECAEASAERTELLAATDKSRRLEEEQSAAMTRVQKGSISSGRSTPRPLWDAASEVVDVALELDTTKPTAEIVDKIAGYLKETHAEIRTLQQKIASAPRSKSGKAQGKGRRKDAPEQEKWIVCRGTAPQVPKYLRRNGRVRNNRWSKRQTEDTLTDFWAAKKKHDAEPGAVVATVPDFLFKFLLERNNGSHGSAVEAGYNLLESIKRHGHDADCELFARIVHNELSEAAYHDQMEHVQGFIKLCHEHDCGEGERVEGDGLLSRDVFLECLDKYFVHKPQPELRALKKALSYDLPLTPEVDYAELFKPDKDGNQGKFAETMRDQHTYDLIQSYMEVESCIRNRVIQSLQAEPEVTSLTDCEPSDWEVRRAPRTACRASSRPTTTDHRPCWTHSGSRSQIVDARGVRHSLSVRVHISREFHGPPHFITPPFRCAGVSGPAQGSANLPGARRVQSQTPYASLRHCALRRRRPHCRKPAGRLSCLAWLCPRTDTGAGR